MVLLLEYNIFVLFPPLVRSEHNNQTHPCLHRKQTKNKSSGMQKACNIGTAIDGGKGLSLKESVKGMIKGIDCFN